MERRTDMTMSGHHTHTVLFPPGAYGNFIEWLIRWLRESSLIAPPWDDRFLNSHNNDFYMFGIEHMVSSEPIDGSLAHIFDSNMSSKLSDIFDRVLTRYDKIVHVTPTINDILWISNRRAYRTDWDDFFISHEHYFKDSISGWNKEKLSDMEIWEKREYISSFYYKWQIQENGIEEVLSYSNPKVLTIFTCQIRDDFYSVVDNLCSFLNITTSRTPQEISLIHEQWYERQPEKFRDREITDIIHDILQGKDADMSALTLVDQAEIQRRLREDHGKEIRCYKLNTWPSTTSELLKLIYDA